VKADSIPPTRRQAVDEEFEDENVFDWLRRQARATRKPTPPRGITQVAPNKKTTPVAPDAVSNQITGKD